jgi:hypothetical protein
VKHREGIRLIGVSRMRLRCRLTSEKNFRLHWKVEASTGEHAIGNISGIDGARCGPLKAFVGRGSTGTVGLSILLRIMVNNANGTGERVLTLYAGLLNVSAAARGDKLIDEWVPKILWYKFDANAGVDDKPTLAVVRPVCFRCPEEVYGTQSSRSRPHRKADEDAPQVHRRERSTSQTIESQDTKVGMHLHLTG